MRWLLSVAFAGCAALILAACGGAIILGPTDPADGIIIFIHANFAGTSQQMAVDVTDLGDVEGPCLEGDEDSRTGRWDDCISSVRVMPGWKATFYRDDDFKGQSFTLTADAPDLTRVPGPCDGSFNDCVTSIRVSRQ
jgi:hypothetical protein